MVPFSLQGIASKHARCGTQNLIFHKLLPMSPDRTVTHVPGLDPQPSRDRRERSPFATLLDAPRTPFVMYLHIKMTKLLLSLTLSLATISAQVKIIGEDSRIHVEIGGKPYADFVVKSD